MLSVVSVQPFANEVANYTCCNRDKKGGNIVHIAHLLPAGKSRQHGHYNTAEKTCPLFSYSPSELERVHPATAGRKNSGTGTEGIGSFRLLRCLWCQRSRKVSRLRKIFSGRFAKSSASSCHRQSAKEGCNLSLFYHKSYRYGL